jgi:hypothetical protein
MIHFYTPGRRLVRSAKRMLGLLTLNVVKGRLEASDTIFELIKDAQDNCIMEIHRVNDEIMVNRALNVYK